ncbi:MAG: AbrB/MazE/SpoVT family DNA-binding domain-containing protein [Bacillota bacterium]
MEIAKITSKGQITIPVDIRKKLNLKDGDKVIFIEDGDKIFFTNAAKLTFANMQKDIKDEADNDKAAFTFSWKGALSNIREQYTSVELQHKSLEWR